MSGLGVSPGKPPYIEWEAVFSPIPCGTALFGHVTSGATCTAYTSPVPRPHPFAGRRARAGHETRPTLAIQLSWIGRVTLARIHLSVAYTMHVKRQPPHADLASLRISSEEVYTTSSILRVKQVSSHRSGRVGYGGLSGLFLPARPTPFQWKWRYIGLFHLMSIPLPPLPN